MKYALLIHSDETTEPDPTSAEHEALMAEYQAFVEALEAAGAMVDGHRLRPTTTATTLRVRNGEVLASDGPFAETKEQFGGFFLIDVPDLDQALEWARRIPSAREGSIEVRPIWEDEEGEHSA